MDKKTYWANRKDGKRGQGEYPVTEKERKDLWKPVSIRKMTRRKYSDPKYTKKRAKR